MSLSSLLARLGGHVDDRLHELALEAGGGAGHSSLREHLARCGRCARALADLERGRDALAGLGPAPPLPESVADAIRERLAAEPMSAPAPRGFPLRWAAAGGAVACLALAFAAATRVSYGPEIAEARAGEPPSAFERAAIELHTQAEGGDAGLERRALSPAELRSFVRERTGLSTPLASFRSAVESARYTPRGARAMKVDGVAAAAVVYDVDAQPVVLLTARQDDVHDRPAAWTPFGKRVSHRLEDGRQVLTWTNSGQVYCLVSRLPRRGLPSCLLCHGDGPRRDQILDLG